MTATSAGDPVLVSVADGVATITLNRPERMNALNYALLSQWRSELQRLLTDDEVRVLILTGAGAHFCTGGDLKDPPAGPNGELRLRVMHDCLKLMLFGDKPVIGALEGNVYGAGFSYATACDIVVAGESARFCAPFTGVGLIPDTGLAYTLPLRIGAGRARQMMLQGLVVRTPQAADWGLVEEAVNDGEALTKAREIASALLRRAPLALGALRRLMARDLQGLYGSLEEELTIQQRLLASEDLQEGRQAFAEKRTPQFRGR